jgi:hypothetical protein
MPFRDRRIHVTSRVVPAGAAVAAVVLIAGCGGGGKKTTTTTTSATTTAKQTTPKAKPKLEQTVRVDKSGAKYASSVGATNGDIVQFRTVVPAAKHPGTVTLTLTQKNGRIEATASANHQTSTAAVVGSGLKMSRVHFACELPPTPSFCPAKHSSSSKTGYQLQFPAVRKAPIIVAARVGTTAPPAPKLKPASSAAVSPYKLTQKVKVATPKSTSTSKPTSAATVHPGDVVTLSTYVGGKVSGALQPVTISFEQGPAKSVTVTATEPGGSATHATISGAGGAKISLTDPRYNCFLPPDPTFCPSSKVSVGHRKYDITFRVSPNKSPVEVVANVQAG